MKSYISLVIFVFLDLISFGCVKNASNMMAQSSDIVLYTSGNEGGKRTEWDYTIDQDSMFLFAEALNISRETFPDLSGDFNRKDQTKEEMMSSISDVIKRLRKGTTLWWYLVGHGMVNSFTTVDEDTKVTYDEFFEHMSDQIKLNPSIEKIKRIVILMQSCHSGSIIPIVQKYQGSLFEEVIVFTPVSTEERSVSGQFFPELVGSATFLRVAHEHPNLSVVEIITEVGKRLDAQHYYPSRFDRAMSTDKNCSNKISFSSQENLKEESSKIKEEECSVQIPDIKLSNKKEPTWQDLVDLTVWLFKNYNGYAEGRTPQFYTYPDNLKNEPLFSKRR